LVIEHDAFQHVRNGIIARTNAQDFVFEIVRVMSQELTRARPEEREKILALLETIVNTTMADGSGWVEGRENLVDELRQQIKEMK
jgi:hypothetical protein